MSFEKIKVTNKGRQLLAKAAAGSTLTFTRLKMGDGQMTSQVIETMADVISEKISLKLNEPTAINGRTNIEGTFRNAAAQDNFKGDGTTKIFKLSAAPTSLSNVKVNGTEITAYIYSAGIITFNSAPPAASEIQITYNLEGFYWREVALFALDPDEGEIMFAYQNAFNLAEYIASASSEIVEKIIALSFTFSSDLQIKIDNSGSLVLMPLSQGQYKTELLELETVIDDADFIPLYKTSKLKNARVTVDGLKSFFTNYMKTLFQEKPDSEEIVLLASEWDATEKAYDFDASYPNASYDIVIELNGGKASEDQTEAWDSANIKGNYPKNTLYAKGDVPTIDIPVIRTVIKK